MQKTETTLDDILAELSERIQRELEDVKENQKYGVNTPGFNQSLGAYDALNSFHKFILGEDEQ